MYKFRLLSLVVASLAFLPHLTLAQYFRESELTQMLQNQLTESETIYGLMRGRFGIPSLQKETEPQTSRQGRKLTDRKNSRLWPNARVPYEFADTIDHQEWLTMQTIFSNISSVTNIEFIPRTARDTDYLLITEDIQTYGCGCCSIGVGYLEGSGAHVLVLAPVAEGGCGVNHIGGTHEMLHILGLAHVQNRADRCNYIDVDTSNLVGWGEWRVGQLTGVADWFQLRIPYDCSSYVHYYQLQGAVWKEEVMKKVDYLMESQGCEDFQRGEFVNKCLLKGGYTENGRIIKDGYDRCLDQWDKKHKVCVENVIKRYPTFHLLDPNGRCKQNGINRVKRSSHQLSQWDIWALNAAYGGPLPPCQYPERKGNGICDIGNNNIGCDYDGGDCCLPQAAAQDCIDPCGVRLKFYNGTNRHCSKAPERSEFCGDHYWYGPNRCGPQYCQATDEKYLEWQCKKSCDLCNSQPSRKEMDEICEAFIPERVRAQYDQRQQPPSQKPSQPVFKPSSRPSKPTSRPSKPTSRPSKPTSRPSKPSVRPSKPSDRPSKPSNRPSKPSRPGKNTGKPSNINQIPSNQTKKEKNNKRNNRKQKNKNEPEETVRSSSKGFQIISDPDRRLAMRSYWMRRG